MFLDISWHNFFFAHSCVTGSNQLVLYPEVNHSPNYPTSNNRHTYTLMSSKKKLRWKIFRHMLYRRRNHPIIFKLFFSKNEYSRKLYNSPHSKLKNAKHTIATPSYKERPCYRLSTFPVLSLSLSRSQLWSWCVPLRLLSRRHHCKTSPRGTVAVVRHVDQISFAPREWNRNHPIRKSPRVPARQDT